MQLEPAERFQKLLDDLGSSGFKITPDQKIRATGLFLELQLTGVVEYNRQRFGNMLSTVICKSAEEQQKFKRVFTYWYPKNQPQGFRRTPRQESAYGGNVSRIQEEQLALREEALRRQREAQLREFRKQMKVVLPVFITVFVLLFSMPVLLVRLVLGEWPVPVRFNRRRSTNNEAQTEEEGAPNTEKVQPLPSTDPETVQPPASTDLEVDLPENSTELPTYLDSVVSAWEATEQVLGPTSILLLLIPLALIAVLIASSKKLISAYARQTQILASSQFRHLLSQGRKKLDLVDQGFFHDVQPMRRQVRQLSDRIDIAATVEASIQHAGYFSPVYMHRRVSPEYIVLIDRRDEKDHRAHYSRALTRSLEQAGVHVVTYTFDSDPRRITIGTNQRILHLEDLSTFIDTHRLILFTDGDGLIDMSTGRLYDWAHQFTEWPKAVLFTPKDLKDWGRSEWLLEARLGMHVLPATDLGLLIASEIFDEESGIEKHHWLQPERLMPERNRLYGFFSVGAWRWVDEVEPEKSEVDQLIEILQNRLSVDAYEWLRGLAVYPTIYWSLTLFIGANVLGKSGNRLFNKQSLLELTRLPWLSFGHMPNWLRKRLVQEMTPSLDDRVRKALEKLLLTVVSRDPKDFTMEMGLDKDQKKIPPSMRRIDQDEYRRDTILIDFMTQRQASSSDFRFSSRVAQALGLPQLRSSIQSALGKEEKSMMKKAARELTKFVREHPINRTNTITKMISSSEYGPGVREITKYVSTNGDIVPLPQRFFLYKKNPNKKKSIILNEFALNLLRQRKGISFQFSVMTMILLIVLLSIIYWQFFDDIGSFGAGMFFDSIYYIYAIFSV